MWSHIPCTTGPTTALTPLKSHTKTLLVNNICNWKSRKQWVTKISCIFFFFPVNITTQITHERDCIYLKAADVKHWQKRCKLNDNYERRVHVRTQHEPWTIQPIHTMNDSKCMVNKLILWLLRNRCSIVMCSLGNQSLWRLLLLRSHSLCAHCRGMNANALANAWENLPHQETVTCTELSIRQGINHTINGWMQVC